MFLSSSKVGTRPIDVDLLLCVASYSPNLDKFVKVVYNVVFGSPLHLRGIGLERETHSMFVKRKLNGNSHWPNKGIYRVNIPMTNCPPPSTRQSLDPLCIPFLIPDSNLDNINHNTLYEETPTNTTPLRSLHVHVIPFGMVIEFGVPMVESYVPLDH